MPRTEHRRGSMNCRSTAAGVPRGAISDDSTVRTERWGPSDRVTCRPGGQSGGSAEPPLAGRTHRCPAGR
ncbi:hypothetical protein CVT30_37470 [Streptomyces sp. AMCC400023]|nr:hypothetical protein CVT30_37470 [Streptomyces sp. AMCC400023]